MLKSDIDFSFCFENRFRGFRVASIGTVPLPRVGFCPSVNWRVTCFLSRTVSHLTTRRVVRAAHIVLKKKRRTRKLAENDARTVVGMDWNYKKCIAFLLDSGEDTITVYSAVGQFRSPGNDK